MDECPPSLFLKSKILPCNIFCAPMLGCTDFSFRKILSLFSPELIFCEMVNVESMAACSKKSHQMLAYREEMRPIGAQLCGNTQELLVECAKKIEDLGFDAVDINCGCPSKRTTKQGLGAFLLLHPKKIGHIVDAIKRHVHIPVSVKIRMGWDEKTILATEVVKIVEEAGAEFITIHGRTQKQQYQGKANWEIIRECKAIAKKIKIIGNGDIFTAEDAINLFKQSGCDGIMLARGLLGNPWLIEDIRARVNNQKISPRSFQTKTKVLQKHLHYIFEVEQNPRVALLKAKQVSFWYFNSFEGAKSIRKKIRICQKHEEIFHVISEEMERSEKILLHS